MRPKVYLAGPITGLTFGQGNDWRINAEKMLNPEIHALSPFRGKHDLFKYDQLLGDVHDPNEPLIHDRGVFLRDMNDVMQVDAVLVNFRGAKRISIGTVFELGVAYHARRPVIAIMDDLHRHAFIRESSVYEARDLEHAIQLTKFVLGVETRGPRTVLPKSPQELAHDLDVFAHRRAVVPSAPYWTPGLPLVGWTPGFPIGTEGTIGHSGNLADHKKE